MGRHSSRSQGLFLRSFIGWIALWVAIAAITGVAVWVIVKAIGGPQPSRPTRADATESASPRTTEEDDIVISTETVAPTSSPTPEPTSEEVALITEGVTVQVLNGTAAPDSGEAMASRLRGLGFVVIAVEESSRAYPRTTVFWSQAASEEAATALASRFEWEVAEKPSNLSSEVSVHVVVGADEV